MIKYDVIKHFAEMHPEKIALKDDVNVVSWEAFRDATKNITHSLNALDSQFENPVLIFSSNSLDVVMLGAALSTIGVAYQVVDHHLEIDSIEKIIAALSVDYVFIAEAMAEKLESLADFCQIKMLERFVNEAAANQLLPELSFETRPFKSYSFTSGTTGMPKIVYRTKSFDKPRFDYLIKRFNFTGEDTHLACLPMYHVATTGWLRMFLGLGCTIIIHDYQSIFDLCEILHTNNVSTTIMSPVMLRGVTANIDADGSEKFFANLRFVITGGKNFSNQHKKEVINKLGAIVYEYYGTTETGVNALLDPHDVVHFPGSVGTVFEGNEIEIVDEQGQPVDQGCIGRIAIYSYMNMDRFLNYKTETITIADKTFILTSDYGYKNKEGYLYVLRRSNQFAQNTHDFYGLENEILKLNYIADVYVSDKTPDQNVSVNVVMKQYRALLDVRRDIDHIAKKFNIKSCRVNVLPALNYTHAGKIKDIVV